MTVGEKAGKRFLQLADGHSLDHPSVAEAADRIALGSRIDAGILLVVVWAMVAKPML